MEINEDTGFYWISMKINKNIVHWKQSYKNILKLLYLNSWLIILRNSKTSVLKKFLIMCSYVYHERLNSQD